MLTPVATPVAPFELARASAVDIARSVGRIAFKNIRRTRDVVDSEYNSGQWGRILSERSWLQEPTLESFLIGQDDHERMAKVDGQIVRIKVREYYRYRLGALAKLVSDQAGEATSVLELGAGYGYNLFALSSDPRWSSLRGLDIAANGIEAGRQIASHYGLQDRVTFDRIDLTDAADPRLPELSGATILTYFCIEQIPYAVEAVVDHILSARPARVINIEPAVDMLTLTDPRDVASRIYIRSMDYQTQLFALLDQLETQKRVRVLSRQRMGFAPSLHNDGLLYVWEPVV